MQLDQSKDQGGQHVARLLKVLPPEVQEVARQIMEGQHAASVDPRQLRELSSSLMQILLQLMAASSPHKEGQEGEGGGGGSSGAQGQSGQGSQSPQGGGAGQPTPGGVDGGQEEGQEESEGQQGQEGQQAQSLSDLMKELFGADPQSAQGSDAQAEDQEQGEEGPESGIEEEEKASQDSDGAQEEFDKDSEGEPEESPVPADKAGDSEGNSSESEDSGQSDTTEGSTERAVGDPNAPTTPQEIPLTPEEQERLDAEADLRAFLEVLERVIKGRAKRRGSGKSRWVAWSPGDVFVEPDEILRYREDDAYGVPPEQRRAIHRRDDKSHLVVVALDSSGSVSDILFALLHTGMAIVADMLSEVEDVHLGVCQFSGGAKWTLPPTGDLTEIDWFSKQPAERLFHGGTTVSEVFKILGSEIAEYKSVDVVTMTDGYVEPGEELAKQVDFYSSLLGCEIKVHGVVFRGRGSTRKFEKAKELSPASIRVWHVGTEPPKPDPAAQAAKQQRALKELTPAQRDELRRLRDAKRKEGQR